MGLSFSKASANDEMTAPGGYLDGSDGTHALGWLVSRADAAASRGSWANRKGDLPRIRGVASRKSDAAGRQE